MSPLYGGAERVRTDDLLNANQPLFQLSYGPRFVRGAIALCSCLLFLKIVLRTGLEPTRLSPYAPQTYASACSATTAFFTARDIITLSDAFVNTNYVRKSIYF